MSLYMYLCAYAYVDVVSTSAKEYIAGEIVGMIEDQKSPDGLWDVWDRDGCSSGMCSGA